MYRITNISSSADLSTTLDLKAIGQKLNITRKNYKRFNGLVIKLNSPQATAILFESGKIVIIGSHCLMESELALYKIVGMLKDIRINTNPKDYCVNNIASTLKLPFQINILKFVLEHAQYIQYDVELFPGAFYRNPDLGVVMIIFYQGKIILTGAKDEHVIKKAVTYISNLLNAYKRS